MDYGNNTFLHPPAWHEPEAVAAIVYFAGKVEHSNITSRCPRNVSFLGLLTFCHYTLACAPQTPVLLVYPIDRTCPYFNPLCK